MNRYEDWGFRDDYRFYLQIRDEHKHLLEILPKEDYFNSELIHKILYYFNYENYKNVFLELLDINPNAFYEFSFIERSKKELQIYAANRGCVFAKYLLDYSDKKMLFFNKDGYFYDGEGCIANEFIYYFYTFYNGEILICHLSEINSHNADIRNYDDVVSLIIDLDYEAGETVEDSFDDYEQMDNFIKSLNISKDLNNFKELLSKK